MGPTQLNQPKQGRIVFKLTTSAAILAVTVAFAPPAHAWSLSSWASNAFAHMTLRSPTQTPYNPPASYTGPMKHYPTTGGIAAIRQPTMLQNRMALARMRDKDNDPTNDIAVKVIQGVSGSRPLFTFRSRTGYEEYRGVTTYTNGVYSTATPPGGFTSFSGEYSNQPGGAPCANSSSNC